MIRSILLALAEPPHDSSAGDFAFWLARKEECYIHALAVLDIAAFGIPILSSADGFVPSIAPPPLNEGQSNMKERMAAAGEHLEAFAALCAARGLACSTEIRSGIPGDVISRSCAAHDIVVVSRGGYNGIRSSHAVDPLVASVIRDSVRPVLVAGSESGGGRDLCNVLVAYDGSAHASRALPVAAELASRPGVNCTLCTVASSEENGAETLEPAEAFLRHHRVTPQKRVIVHSKPSEVICDLAASSGVDLLVMGAYGHSPIREVLFGSTTERILNHCAASVVLQS